MSEFDSVQKGTLDDHSQKQLAQALKIIQKVKANFDLTEEEVNCFTALKYLRAKKFDEIQAQTKILEFFSYLEKKKQQVKVNFDRYY